MNKLEQRKSWEILECEYIGQIEQLNMRLRCAQEWIRLYSQGETISEMCRRKNIDKILVYGASDMAVFFIDFCIREGIPVIGISDSKITKSAMDYKGIPFILIGDSERLEERKENNERNLVFSMVFLSI